MLRNYYCDPLGESKLLYLHAPSDVLSSNFSRTRTEIPQTGSGRPSEGLLSAYLVHLRAAVRLLADGGKLLL